MTPAHRRPPAFCWRCGRRTDADTQVAGPGEGPPPEAGDVSVCFYCAAIGLYTAEGRIREPSPAELRDLIGNEAVAEAVGLVLAYRGLE